MGIAVLSGIIDSLDTTTKLLNETPKWESHTPGTLTPVGEPDASVPTRFIACVSREESAKKLHNIFGSLGPLGQSVEVLTSQNLQAVKSADVVLLWWETAKGFTILC